MRAQYRAWLLFVSMTTALLLPACDLQTQQPFGQTLQTFFEDFVRQSLAGALV